MEKDFGNNNPSEGDVGKFIHIPPLFSRAKPRRVIITDKQFKVYFSCLVDITSESKKPKLIGKQSKLEYCIKQILDEVCVKTSGGIISSEFNQLVFRSNPMKNGDIPSRDTVSRSIKNIEHYQMLIKIKDGIMTKSASEYELGQIVKDILDPIIIKRMERNRAENNKKVRFKEMGFDFRQTKLCPCCEDEQYITDFGIFEHKTNLSIIEIKPVCEKCQKARRSGKMSEEWMIRFNSAWATFYRKIEQ